MQRKLAETRAAMERCFRAFEAGTMPDALRGELHAARETGDPIRIKTVLQALTDEVRVDAREAIEPIFRVPAVRPPSRSVLHRPTSRTPGCP